MAHKRSKTPKLSLELFDKTAPLYGWTILKKGDDYRVYERENLILTFKKTIPFGYKVVRYRDRKPVITDSLAHKEMALNMFGEAILFDRW